MDDVSHAKRIKNKVHLDDLREIINMFMACNYKTRS